MMGSIHGPHAVNALSPHATGWTLATCTPGQVDVLRPARRACGAFGIPPSSGQHTILVPLPPPFQLSLVDPTALPSTLALIATTHSPIAAAPGCPRTAPQPAHLSHKLTSEDAPRLHCMTSMRVSWGCIPSRSPEPPAVSCI